MPITDGSLKSTYACDGWTTSFPITFPHINDVNGDAVGIGVIVRSPQGEESTLLKGTGYTVAGNNVVTPTPISTGFTLVIFPANEFTQENDWLNGGALDMRGITRAFDKLTLLARELRELVNRQVHDAISDEAGSLQLPPTTERPNKLLGFDELGRLVAYTGGMTAKFFDLSYAAIETMAAEARAIAQQAIAAADGRIEVFAQAEAPTEGISLGDLWIDTDDPLQTVYRYNGLEWEPSIPTTAIEQTAIAQLTADQKITTYFTDEPPTIGLTEGDLWVAPESHRLFRWSGEAWEDIQDTLIQVVDSWLFPNTTLINGANIYTGTVKALSIDTEDLFSEDIVVGGQIRSANASPFNGVIPEGETGFWLNHLGKLIAANAQLMGTLRTGPGAAQDARVAIQDQSGIIDGPNFVGSGNNDLAILASGERSGNFEIEITVTDVPSSYRIGDQGPAGGIIFYIDTTTTPYTYYEAWIVDEANTYQWYTQMNSTETTGTAIGTGYSNTYYSMAGSQYPAAQQIRTRTYGGYNDWYLPSKDELNQLYLQKDVIGRFVDSTYWSSSAANVGSTYYQYFANGNTGITNKDYAYPIRAIRSFQEAVVHDKFKWRETSGIWSSDIEMEYVTFPFVLNDGTNYEISISFGSYSGHIVGDSWTFTQGGMKGVSVKDTTGEVYLECYGGEVRPKTINMGTDGVIKGEWIIPTDRRNDGIIGTYDSYKTQQIWSMGKAYRNAADGSSFGNLYGAAYTYSNRVYSSSVMANGHQFVWCQNGVPWAALGSGIWTAGALTHKGASNNVRGGFFQSTTDENQAISFTAFPTALQGFATSMGMYVVSYNTQAIVVNRLNEWGDALCGWIVYGY